MKNLRLVIGIVVILAIVCSPVLAVSKADLIASYKGQSDPTIPTPTPIPTSTPKPIPTTPTPITPTDGGWCASRCAAPLSVTSTPTQATVFIDGSHEGLTPITIHGLSAGTHQLMVFRVGYEDYSTEVVIPEPSYHIIIGSGKIKGSIGCVCDTQTQTIDVTLKKVQKPTIPTIMPKTQYLSLFF